MGLILKSIYIKYVILYGKQREATALIHTSNTATLVPEFAVEDLPLGRTAALVPEFAVKGLPWAEHSDDDMLIFFWRFFTLLKY